MMFNGVLPHITLVLIFLVTSAELARDVDDFDVYEDQAEISEGFKSPGEKEVPDKSLQEIVYLLDLLNTSHEEGEEEGNSDGGKEKASISQTLTGESRIMDGDGEEDDLIYEDDAEDDDKDKLSEKLVAEASFQKETAKPNFTITEIASKQMPENAKLTDQKNTSQTTEEPHSNENLLKIADRFKQQVETQKRKSVINLKHDDMKTSTLPHIFVQNKKEEPLGMIISPRRNNKLEKIFNFKKQVNAPIKWHSWNNIDWDEYSRDLIDGIMKPEKIPLPIRNSDIKWDSLNDFQKQDTKWGSWKDTDWDQVHDRDIMDGFMKPDTIPQHEVQNPEMDIPEENPDKQIKEADAFFDFIMTHVWIISMLSIVTISSCTIIIVKCGRFMTSKDSEADEEMGYDFSGDNKAKQASAKTTIDEFFP